MATRVDQFLLSLAVAMASALGESMDGTPRGLWVHGAIEPVAADPHSTLRIYGGTDVGAFSGARVLSVAVQCDTRGTLPAATIARAWAVFETLKDAEDRPRMHWPVPGRRFAANGSIEADPDKNWSVRMVRFNGAPGLVGVDEAARRVVATFNVDVDFEQTEA